jgi:hypothetical protein
VHDVAAAVAEYHDRFGFSTEYVAGAPPVFAIVGRDGLSLMLRAVDPALTIAPNEQQGGTWDAFFWVRDVDGLFDELVKRHATIVYAPVDQQAYRMREFAVRDTSGYVLGFGQPMLP